MRWECMFAQNSLNLILLKHQWVIGVPSLVCLLCEERRYSLHEWGGHAFRYQSKGLRGTGYCLTMILWVLWRVSRLLWGAGAWAQGFRFLVTFDIFLCVSVHLTFVSADTSKALIAQSKQATLSHVVQNTHANLRKYRQKMTAYQSSLVSESNSGKKYKHLTHSNAHAHIVCQVGISSAHEQQWHGVCIARFSCKHQGRLSILQKSEKTEMVCDI